MTLTISPRRVAGGLASVAVAIILASTAGQLVKFWAGHPQVYGLVPLFFVGQENNIPTFFSSALLLIAAVLLGVISTYKRNDGDVYALHWRVLALIFFYMAVDEMASLHELFIKPMREMLGAGGLLYFAWVIPFAVLLLVFAVYFGRFYLHLATSHRRLFALAGMTYVGGAMGLELLGGQHVDRYGTENLTYKLFQTAEESLEMFGAILFIYGLLRYVSAYAPFGMYRVEDAPEPDKTGARAAHSSGECRP